MSAHETFFFRHPAQYEALRSVVIPALIPQRRETRKLSFWSAAAASGQEAYCLAMMLLEMGLGDWKTRILGTDASSQMAERARAGKYLQIEVNRGLPATYLVKYFRHDGLDWQLRDEVRRMVGFSTFDMQRNMSALGPFDAVFCRNVLIYLNAQARRRVLEQVHGTFSRGGYLLLGGAEIPLHSAARFERIELGAAVLYRAP
jgi:chemotaxis protein methyltransferase CheR